MIDVHGRLEPASDDEIAIVRKQEVPSEFLQTLSDDRLASVNERAKEYHRVASIPVVIVEKWLKQGFDVYREPAKAILRRLRNENLGAFITSAKGV